MASFDYDGNGMATRMEEKKNNVFWGSIFRGLLWSFVLILASSYKAAEGVEKKRANN